MKKQKICPPSRSDPQVLGCRTLQGLQIAVPYVSVFEPDTLRLLAGVSRDIEELKNGKVVELKVHQDAPLFVLRNLVRRRKKVRTLRIDDWVRLTDEYLEGLLCLLEPGYLRTLSVLNCSQLSRPCLGRLLGSYNKVLYMGCWKAMTEEDCTSPESVVETQLNALKAHPDAEAGRQFFRFTRQYHALPEALQKKLLKKPLTSFEALRPMLQSQNFHFHCLGRKGMTGQPPGTPIGSSPDGLQGCLIFVVKVRTKNGLRMDFAWEVEEHHYCSPVSSTNKKKKMIGRKSLWFTAGIKRIILPAAAEDKDDCEV